MNLPPYGTPEYWREVRQIINRAKVDIDRLWGAFATRQNQSIGVGQGGGSGVVPPDVGFTDAYYFYAEIQTLIRREPDSPSALWSLMYKSATSTRNGNSELSRKTLADELTPRPWGIEILYPGGLGAVVARMETTDQSSFVFNGQFPTSISISGNTVTLVMPTTSNNSVLVFA